MRAEAKKSDQNWGLGRLPGDVTIELRFEGWEGIRKGRGEESSYEIPGQRHPADLHLDSSPTETMMSH